MEGGSIAILVLLSVLLISVIIWVAYIFSRPDPSSPPPPPGSILPETYKRKITVEIYSLLPEFLLGELEAHFSMDNLSYPSGEQGLRVKDVFRNDKFDIEVSPGKTIKYVINRISDGVPIYQNSYTFKMNTLEKIDKLYLCDGAIVDNNHFLPNFQYRFVGNWANNMCTTLELAWASKMVSNVISDDTIPCQTPPSSLTTPYTYNTLFTPETAGWKGAWVGMKWSLGVVGQEDSFGSVTVKDKDLHVLVITPKDLVMSSS